MCVVMNNVAMMMLWVGVCQLRFNYLFRAPVTLSTKTHRHYNESVHRNKQHTRGNDTIA